MEYQAGRGTTALGTVGTVLGSIGTAGVLSNVLGNGNGLPLLGNGLNGWNNGTIQALKECEAKDMEIAQLKAEKYTDGAVLDLYKYVDGQIKDIRENANLKWTEQAVINAKVDTGLATLSGQVQSVANTVAGITRTAVPASAICNFGCGCNTCCNNNQTNLNV